MATITEMAQRLEAAGMGEQVQTAFTEVAARAGQDYERIRADENLSDTGRLEALAEAAEKWEGVLSATLEGHVAKVVKQDRDDAAVVFGTRGLAGDPSMLAVSVRDAADRVERAEGDGKRREMLQMATRSGDEVMARAVVAWAIRSGVRSLVDEFLADRPHQAAPVDRLWQAARYTPQERWVQNALNLAAVFPEELPNPRAVANHRRKGLDNDEVRGLLRGVFGGADR